MPGRRSTSTQAACTLLRLHREGTHALACRSKQQKAMRAAWRAGRHPTPLFAQPPVRRGHCGGRPSSRRARRPAVSIASQSLDKEELRLLLGPDRITPDYEEHSDEHVEELVEAAAGLISVIDELRPLDPSAFNPAYEIWKAIAAVPPAERVRILDELEPGAIYGLWKASVGRYALDGERSTELFGRYFIWDDFPSSPGEVFTYEGVCEQFFYRKPADPLAVDGRMQGRFPRAVPWLKPAPASLAAPSERFKQQFFLSNRTGLLHSRLLLDAPGLLKLLAPLMPPIYNRVEIGVTLTPSSADAGADVTLSYPADAVLLKQARDAGVALSKDDLPSGLWRPPRAAPAWSPLSFGPRDYMRAAGPGLFVGCAYRTDEDGAPLEEEHVYFALARRY